MPFETRLVVLDFQKQHNNCYSIFFKELTLDHSNQKLKAFLKIFLLCYTQQRRMNNILKETETRTMLSAYKLAIQDNWRNKK